MTRIEEYDEQLERYADQKPKKETKLRLKALDHWLNSHNELLTIRFQNELPIACQHRGHIIRDELVKLTEWKMLRGQWRPRNLQV